MQINLIDQNNQYNNPNFKKLYVTPKTLKQIGHTRESLLASNAKLRKLSQLFDVRVTKDNYETVKLSEDDRLKRLKYFKADSFKQFLKSSIAAGIGFALPLFGALESVPVLHNLFLGLGTFAGIGTIFAIKNAFSSISDMKNKNTEFKNYNVNLIEKGLIGEREYTLPEHAYSLEGEAFKENQKRTFLSYANNYTLSKLLKRKDEDGNNIFHGLLFLPLRLYREVESTLLKKLLIEKNNKGETPLHNFEPTELVEVLRRTSITKEEAKKVLLDVPESTGVSIAETLFAKFRLTNVEDCLSGALEPTDIKEAEHEYIKKLVNMSVDVDGTPPIIKRAGDGNLTRMMECLYECEDYETLNKFLHIKDLDKKTVAERLLDDITNDYDNELLDKICALDTKGYPETKFIAADYAYKKISAKYDETLSSCLHSTTKKNDYSKFLIKALSFSPDRFAEVNQWEDSEGNLPIHLNMDNAVFIAELVKTLKDKPEVLKTLFLTPKPNSVVSFAVKSISEGMYCPTVKDILGEKDYEETKKTANDLILIDQLVSQEKKTTLLHKVDSLEDLKEYHRVLSIKPENLVKAYSVKDENGFTPMYYFAQKKDEHNVENNRFVSEAINALGKQSPEALKEILNTEYYDEKTRHKYPVLAKLDFLATGALGDFCGTDYMNEYFTKSNERRTREYICNLLKPVSNGNSANAFHKIKFLSDLKSIFEKSDKYLDDYLKEAFLTKDNIGRLPIHIILDEKPADSVEMYSLAIIERLKNHPDILREMVMQDVILPNSEYVVVPAFYKHPKVTYNPKLVQALKEVLGKNYYEEFQKIEEKAYKEILEKHKNYDSSITANELTTIIKKVVEKNPNDLKKLLGKNSQGNVNIIEYHKAGKAPFKELFTRLKNYPSLLTDIFFIEGNISKHLLSYLESKQTQWSILNRFMDIIEYDMDSMTRVYSFLKNRKSRYLNSMSLQSNLKACFGDFLSKIPEQNIYSADEMYEILTSPIVANFDGRILNEKYDSKGNTLLFSILDIMPTDENKYKLSQLASMINNLTGVDFNAKDPVGFTFKEKVLFTENEPMLKAFLNRSTIYTPSLDILYNNIENENFKNLASRMKVEFPDIIEALKLKSLKTLTMLKSQFESPFYDKNVNGVQIWEILQKMDKPFRLTFYKAFGKYLPEYAAYEGYLESLK